MTPGSITPDRDGRDDVAVVRYSVSEPVTVTLQLVGEDGRAYDVRDRVPRSPGAYEAMFGGVVDGRMVPEGKYTLRVSAEPRKPGGRPARDERGLEVRGGDRTPPTLEGFAVRPAVFTPNQDGLDDRVSVSYSLSEPADIRVWLEDRDGAYVSDILAEKRGADDPGAVGPHVYEYDAGVDADAPPPPDGDYRVVAEARDASGNVSTARADLAIRHGGQPRAGLRGDVQWSATTVPIGDTLWFTATVANVGSTPIRTRGPEPGTVYDNNATFNRAAPAAVLLLARSGERGDAALVHAGDEGDREVVLDLATRQRGDGPAEPARIGGADVPAGDDEAGPKRRTVCGMVRDGQGIAAGVDVFAFESDGDNGVRTTTNADGRFCFADLVIPPAHERSYSRSPGSVRLGLEYDEARTDVEYPFRWQLGPTSELSVCEAEDRLYLCLAPGQTVTVRGGIRFVEPPYRRTTVAYAALMHEDVRRMHGPYGEQRITVEY